MLAEVVGLGTVEKGVYRALLGDGPAAAWQLALRTRENQARVLRALDRLEREGLAARTAENPPRYAAAPPSAGGGSEGPADAGAAPDDTDLQVLSLLLLGMTDASVARELGLGVRTVQRRVRRLMDLAGASTRLQLGWHAHRQGWVPRLPPA